MITFRRRVSNRLMLSWLDLVSIAESISFSEDCDSVCWAFDGSSKFSVQSMYKIITFRGILPVHTPAVWQLSVPPRIHIFLWLLSNNKILTRINLAKRRHVGDLRCLFYNEHETTHHLFFECIIANIMWKHLSDIFDIALGSNYESIARWWLSNNNHCVLNMSCAALMWCLWKLRNDLCFQAKKMARREGAAPQDFGDAEELASAVQGGTFAGPDACSGSARVQAASTSTTTWIPGAGIIQFGVISWEGVQPCNYGIDL